MPAPFWDLSGQRVMVTGASSGLGWNFARCAARHGADVIVAARRTERLDELTALIEADGGAAVPLALDVMDAASVECCVQAAWPFDVLVNNAGVAATHKSVDVTVEEFDQIVDANLRGAWLMACATARGWIDARRGGAIVNIASILGLRVAGGVGPYAVSKAALIQMTRAHALEWARHGIRVNALAPGYIETGLNEAFFATAPGQELIARIPMRRIGRPGELDGAFLLLASSAGAYMTGAIIPVDGGHLVSSL